MAQLKLLLPAILASVSWIAAATHTAVDPLYSSRPSHITRIVPHPTTYNLTSISASPSDPVPTYPSSWNFTLSISPSSSVAPAPVPAANCTTVTTIYVQPTVPSHAHTANISYTSTHSSHNWNHTSTISHGIVGTGTTSHASGHSSGYAPTSVSQNSTYQSPTLTATITSVVLPVIPTTAVGTTSSKASGTATPAQPSEPLFTGGAKKKVELDVGVVGGVVLGIFAMVL
ncbi:hypothetical protein CC80DRAFT_552130 [Byssothecium circinans]|uniref:Uncharacterized protein n=1 Tax=Byssothecium circinans TaxID=147558 RepID=A0A6A5TII4_9PLEO|nr:hypothetical protein CC80DRAFT_552130 [Byssothecium circinans]